jgi:hypothetical protein
MKNLFTITKDEKNRILEMHKKAYQNHYLTEAKKPATYTDEELNDLLMSLNTKMNEILINKKDDAVSNMKLVGQYLDKDQFVFKLWSPSNNDIVLQLVKSGGNNGVHITDTYSITVSAGKKMLLGSVDISSEITNIISSLTERQKEIMDMDIPNVEGYTFNQVLQDFKPSLAIQGLPEREGMIYADIVKSPINNDPFPVNACQGWSQYQMEVEFPINELLKTEPDGNSKTLRVCYGGLRLNNSSVYITTYPKPFNQMLKAKISSL